MQAKGILFQDFVSLGQHNHREISSLQKEEIHRIRIGVEDQNIDRGCHLTIMVNLKSQNPIYLKRSYKTELAKWVGWVTGQNEFSW